jgi:hypothetical protein
MKDRHTDKWSRTASPEIKPYFIQKKKDSRGDKVPIVTSTGG